MLEASVAFGAFSFWRYTTLIAIDTNINLWLWATGFAEVFGFLPLYGVLNKDYTTTFLTADFKIGIWFRQSWHTQFVETLLGYFDFLRSHS